MASQATNGSYNVTVVSGASYTGLLAPDGSVNVIEADRTYLGVYHPCGALQVTPTTTAAYRGIYAPDGSIYVINGSDRSSGAMPVTVVSGSLFSVVPSLSPISWFDPSDLTTLWKDVAGTDPVLADGDAVARIDDKSGNGRHMIRSTAGERPLYKTDGTLHWLLFDGTDDNFSNNITDYDFALDQTHEITTVVSHLALGSGEAGSLWQYKVSFGSDSADVEFGVYNDGTNYRIRTRYASIDTFSTGSTISSPTTTAHVLGQERRTSSLHKQYVDGAETLSIATASAAFTDTGRANGAGQHTDSSQYIGMRWYGCVVSPPLNTTQRAALTTELGEKAGLSV